ncbi:MAG: response regulator [Desulfobacterales bacterium]|nr:response regulator [Desulfobacterales bacterium]
MKKYSFKSIQTRLIFWFLLLSLIPLGATLIITYHQRVHVIESQTFDKLTAIRDLKVERLNNWLKERKGDIFTASVDTRLTDLDAVINNNSQEQKKLETIESIRQVLNRYMKEFSAYSEIFIINPNTGKIIVSTNKSMEGALRADDDYFIQPMRTREFSIKDIYYSKTLSKHTMAYSIPIFCSLHSGEHIVGILMARFDLNNSLYQMLSNRVGLGKTGETLIVNKDVMALNELRWHENAPLNLKISAQPAVNAAQGQTGIARTLDYRGEEVLAAYTYIPETEWGFVCKQDLYELNAPIREMMIHFVILFVVISILILFTAIYISKSISKPIIDVNATTQKIKEGDYTVRNIVQSRDELGMLAASVNKMAASIESKNTVQKCMMDISDTIIGQSSIEQFGSALLKQLMAITNSSMGVFYILNDAKREFEPLASVGANTDLLRPFNADHPEGELGNAVSQKNIYHLKNIPKDTLFKYKTTVGDAIPKEMMTLPILINKNVVAFISLANLHQFSEESLKILNLSLNSINTAYSDLLANEKAGLLAKNLTKNNQQLEAQAEELQAQSEELQQSSEELQEQNIELEAQRKQVEEANRLKSEFLSNMSHELRTPLNSVMALSRVLLMQTKDKLSEDEASYLEIIERNGKNLLSLINDILDLSKIEAGRMDVNPKRFKIRSTIETIVERLETIAENKNIQLNQQIPDDLPQIESDEHRLHQILQNLISNAVKFTEQGSVTVSAHSDAEKIHITVSDTGIGISKNDLPHIFEEFRQVDGSSARHYEGTGLGLTIAHRAAAMLGGGLSVESTLGTGSRFTLTLPLRWQGSAPVFEPLIMKPSVEIELSQKTVLIVDDEPDTLTMISSYLSEEGYNIITAASGKEAIRLAQIHRPFAITLDIIMPEMDGWEVLQHLKQNPVTKDIPVIVVSFSDNKSTGIALGAVGYISKPVNRNRLTAEIKRIGGPSAYSILVAEDNEIERKDITRTIEQEGMQAIAAENGRVCIDMIKETVPDVLVLDLIMPEMDGFEVLEKVRSVPETRNLPVIVVTAKDLTVEEKQKLDGNVSSILAKSDTTAVSLLEEIKKMIAGIKRHKRGAKAKGREVSDRILLVEDNEAAVIQVKGVLEDEGYIVDVARGGQEALDYMSHTIPGAIVLDLMMPGIDGFQVLEKMRSTQATAKIPVLILTARDLTPEDLGKLSANNISQLVQKGDIDRQELLFKIRSMFGEPSVLGTGDGVLGTGNRGLGTGNLGLGTGDGGSKTGNLGLETGNWKSETEKPEIGKREPLTVKPTRGTNDKPSTILVVEDNPDNMITVRAILRNQYTIIEAMDGEKGLHLALAETPDLILLDMSLPGMDGFSVAARLKQDKKTSHIPIIALTALAMKGDREKILEAGCDDYLPKPVDPEGLVKKIGEWGLGIGD